MGADNDQVGGAFRQERRWGASTNRETSMTKKAFDWRGGRMEEVKEQSRNTVESGGAGGLHIKFVTKAMEHRCGEGHCSRLEHHHLIIWASITRWWLVTHTRALLSYISHIM